MAVAKFVGVYFVVSIGSGLFLGRFIRFFTRATTSTSEESMVAALFRLDGALRSASELQAAEVVLFSDETGE